MADKPYKWVSWSDARFRMPEIWSGWAEPGWCDHADRAFVNALRHRNVSYGGDARENSNDYTARLSRTPIRLENVVAGLLSVTSYGRAEYERARLRAAPAWDKLDTIPQSIVENATADVSGAKLVWEEFRDQLIKYELPDGATPNPDPAEGPSGYGEKRLKAAYKGPLAEWMAPQNLKYLARRDPADIAADFKFYCTERPDLLPLLRLRSMEGTIMRIIRNRTAKHAAVRTKKPGGKGQ
jgi:hypothetical protein